MGAEYNINLHDKFGQLNVIDVAVEAASREPWFNQTLTTVNDAVVRLGVIDGDFHWHHHDDTDEFFLVLDGRFDIALREDGGQERTVELNAGDIFTVPRGTEHKPSSPGGAILMFEPAGTVNTGDRHDDLPAYLTSTTGQDLTG